MHLVAPLGGAQVREAGPGHIDMRGVGMVDRQQHPLFLIGRGEVDNLADAALSDELAQIEAALDRRVGQRERRARAFDEAAFSARSNNQRALFRFVENLSQSHR